MREFNEGYWAAVRYLQGLEGKRLRIRKRVLAGICSLYIIMVWVWLLKKVL